MDISFQNAGSQLRPCAAALVCVLSQDAKNNFGLCRKSLGRGNVEFPLPRLTLVAFFISAPMPGEGVGGGQSLWSFERSPRCPVKFPSSNGNIERGGRLYNFLTVPDLTRSARKRHLRSQLGQEWSLRYPP